VILIGAQKLIPFQLLLLSISFAAITDLDLSGSLDGSGTADLKAVMLFSGSEGDEAYLMLSGPVDEVIVKDRSGLVLEHRIVTRGNDTLVYATVPSDYLEFDISSDSFTAKEGPLWSFDLGAGASENISSFTSTISLPAGTTLKSTNGAVAGDGSSLALSWETNDIDSLHRVRVKASYEIRPSQQPDYSILLIVGAAVLVAIAIISYFMQRKQAQKQRAQQKQQTTASTSQSLPAQTLASSARESAFSMFQPAVHEPSGPSALESNAVFKTLDETDKEIVREIHRQGGKTTQAHLYLHTHVPKATLSRRLASLENKEVVQKSQKGNRNLISLTGIFRS
jgi:hypothetical protein